MIRKTKKATKKSTTKSTAKKLTNMKAVLLKISRSDTEQVILARKTYKDQEYIDLRTYWKPDGKDEFVPTKKGASIPIEKAKKMAQRILKSLREIPPGGEEESII